MKFLSLLFLAVLGGCATPHPSARTPTYSGTNVPRSADGSVTVSGFVDVGASTKF